jgi:dolichol-phosphate mannosyltransferase
MSRLVNWFATGGLGLGVKDCSGSMRCYRVEALKTLGLENLQSNGYAVLEELLVRLQRQGASMAEVPITFTDRKLGKSKLTMREALRSLFQIFSMLGK